MAEHAGRLPFAKGLERGGNGGVLVGEDRRGTQRRVAGARSADGEGRHRYAGRHLHDGQQRIKTPEGFRLHRHAEHRQDRLGGSHAGQVRRATGACDQHFQPAPPRAGSVFEQQVGRAVCGHHAHLVGDGELVQQFRGRLHRLPVGRGAHDDADQRFHCGIVANNARRARNNSRAAAPPAPRSRSLRAAWMRRAHSASSSCGCQRLSSASAGAPSASRRSRQFSRRLKRSLSSAARALCALSAACSGARSTARISLPMYCRCRAAGDAARGADRLGERLGQGERGELRLGEAHQLLAELLGCVRGALARALAWALLALIILGIVAHRVAHRYTLRHATRAKLSRTMNALTPQPDLSRSEPPVQLAEVAALALEEANRQGASHCEADASVSQGLSVSVRLREVDTVEYQRDRGLGVTVYFGKRKGAASTADLSAAAVRETVTKACAIARYTAEDPYAGLVEPEALAREIPELDLDHLWELPPERAIELARECEGAGLAVDARLTNSEGAS